jgi:hypothetical protein
VHRGRVLSRVRIFVSGFHGIIGEKLLNRRVRCWGGGGTVRVLFRSASLVITKDFPG